MITGLAIYFLCGVLIMLIIVRDRVRVTSPKFFGYLLIAPIALIIAAVQCLKIK